MKNKLFSLAVVLCAFNALTASNVITYTASSKLPDAIGTSDEGFHANAFNVAVTSHEFSDSTGVITFVGEVTSIGEDAFWYCTSLRAINIPVSVTNIGMTAFGHCDSLYTITLPESLLSLGGGAFMYCSALKSITIPNLVNGVGNGAFESCTSLTSVTIGNAVKIIGEDAFYNCSALTDIHFGTSLKTIGEDAFGNCTSLTSITFPASLQSIVGDAFSGCSKLTSITIPKSVTGIGSFAFSSCSSLTSITVEAGNPYFDSRDNCNAIIATWNNTLHTGCQSTTIPTSVKKIGEAAFLGCLGLTTMTIPNSVTSIESSAFSSCTSLVSVTIGDSVKSIGRNAFYNCVSIPSITIPDSVKNIQSYAFYNVNNIIYHGTATGSPWGAKGINQYVEGYIKYSDSTKTTLVSCSPAATGKIIIPNSVTSIKNYAFENCSTITSVIIGDSVQTIGNGAFKECAALTQISIGCAVTSIGGSAFDNCSSIKSVVWNAKQCDAIKFGSQVETFVFGDSVEVIPTEICKGMDKISSINIPVSVTSIGTDAFSGCDSIRSVTWDAKNITKWCFSKDVESITFGNSVEVLPTSLSGMKKLTSLSIGHSVKTIEDYTFMGCSYLTTVSFGSGLQNIGKDAFDGCSRIGEMTCYAKVTPNVGNGALTDISSKAYLNVPNDFVHTYEIDPNWGRFLIRGFDDSLDPIQDTVVVEVTETSAEFYWPSIAGASSYTLIIWANAEKSERVCTLYFNAQGRLTKVDFSRMVAAQDSEEDEGFVFEVTGLEAGTVYPFTLEAKDLANQVLYRKEQIFKTENIASSISQTSTSIMDSNKVLRDGVLYIRKDGQTFTILGRQL